MEEEEKERIIPLPKRRAEKMLGAETPESCFSATLRIFGEIGDLEAISAQLGVQPTYKHRRGERRGPRSPKFRHDMWSYTPSIPEQRPLEEHLYELWRLFGPHIDYLKSLKDKLRVDIFCGYRSNSRTAGFEVDHRALKIFTELEVPFGVSVIIF